MSLPGFFCDRSGMRKYPRSNWKALGEEVAAMRLQAGYADTKAWAEAVGRTDRVLLGLERGETVGPKTIEAIAEVLGVPAWGLFQTLTSGGDPDRLAWNDEEVAAAKRRYEVETGLQVAPEARGLLGHFSSEELLAELGERLKAADVPSAPWVRMAAAREPDLSDVDETLAPAADHGDVEEPGENEI